LSANPGFCRSFPLPRFQSPLTKFEESRVAPLEHNVRVHNKRVVRSATKH